MSLKASAQKSSACAMVLLAFLACLPITTAHAEPSAAVCSDYADSYARQASARGQMLAGAAGGAGVGAVVGSIFGGAGAGAAVGAGLGVIVGGARRSASYKKIYEDAFIDCMAGRAR
jgi:uncharacterized protein YcfJ